jgi:hypothetical protein
MSPAGRQSGEYAAPVTQEQFSGFVNEFHIYTQEARSWMESVNSQLSEGQSRMAVLQSDSTEYRKRSDEASSKINLLITKEEVRSKMDAERHRQESQNETVALPAVPVTKPTFVDEIKDKFISALAMVVVAVVMATGWTLLRDYVVTHPNLPGDESSAPAHHEHERGREPINAIPASAPSTGVSPLGPPKQ